MSRNVASFYDTYRCGVHRGVHTNSRDEQEAAQSVVYHYVPDEQIRDIMEMLFAGLNPPRRGHYV